MADSLIRTRDNSTLAITGELAPTSLTIIERGWGLSTFKLTMATIDALDLFAENVGIIVDLDGWIWSGIVLRATREVTSDDDEVTVYGVGDDGLLSDRIVYPDPTVEPPHATVAHVLSGAASSVISAYVSANAGPAAIAGRRIPSLWMGVDSAVGGFVAGRGRYQQLDKFITEIAAAGNVMWRIVQNEPSVRLDFSVRSPVDRSQQVRFAFDVDSIDDLDEEHVARTCTHAIVGGPGTDAARTVQLVTDPTTSARRQERWVEARATGATSADLTQAGLLAIADGRAKVTSKITVPTAFRFGIDYLVGDVVAVDTMVGPALATVLQAEITVTDQVTVKPSIGPVTRPADPLRDLSPLTRS